MSSQQLENAIHHARQGDSLQYSANTENRFLRSIQAACNFIPHSNEAAIQARKIYFSFLMAFGLPAIFLTITPDDLRCFRIVLYSCQGVEKPFGDYNPTDFSDAQILAEFKIRSRIRTDYPGLCAEEYRRIMHLVIKHLFNWDIENQKSNGLGLFAEITAWCLATEEQARKNLHGHFLLFVKNWKTHLDILQRRKDNDSEGLSYNKAKSSVLRFFGNACSARLFGDYEEGGPLSGRSVFHHACNARTKRKIAQDRVHLDIKPVNNQVLRNMRHKKSVMRTPEKSHIVTNASVI